MDPDWPGESCVKHVCVPVANTVNPQGKHASPVVPSHRFRHLELWNCKKIRFLTLLQTVSEDNTTRILSFDSAFITLQLRDMQLTSFYMHCNKTFPSVFRGVKKPFDRKFTAHLHQHIIPGSKEAGRISYMC